MQKTISIQIPDGYEVQDFNKQTGALTFKEKPKVVTERIKTVVDVLADNGLTEDEFKNQCKGLSSDEVGYRLAKLLAKSLNEGWTPNWDSSEYKYSPWFYLNGGSSGFRCIDFGHWGSDSDVGSRLCFKSRELAIYAGNQFTDVYRQFMSN
jgi:hypothetical protein